jgi:hypothetical protein
MNLLIIERDNPIIDPAHKKARPVMFLEEYPAFCPYCAEAISLLIDPSVQQQDYIEDCEVCCRPIHIQVNLQNPAQPLTLLQENETG